MSERLLANTEEVLKHIKTLQGLDNPADFSKVSLKEKSSNIIKTFEDILKRMIQLEDRLAIIESAPHVSGGGSIDAVNTIPSEGGKKITNLYVTADGKLSVEYET